MVTVSLLPFFSSGAALVLLLFTSLCNDNLADSLTCLYNYVYCILWVPTLRLNGRFVQEWPQGGFLCYWAYFTSVVVYKPFTVMLFLLYIYNYAVR